jgi:penicillin amidase
LLLSIAVAVVRSRAALPQTEGRVAVGGLGGPVEILRDADDVVHVRAATEADAIFGLGYAHAQDRLWQMEFQRRIGYGRLAEILGEPALAVDRLFRTVGIARAARQALTQLDPAARGLLDAYARGVNAFVTSRRRWQFPVEFALFGIEPEPWRPEDAIVWQKVLAWSLSMNWREELLRLRLAARVGPDGANELTPTYTQVATSREEKIYDLQKLLSR